MHPTQSITKWCKCNTLTHFRQNYDGSRSKTFRPIQGTATPRAAHISSVFSYRTEPEHVVSVPEVNSSTLQFSHFLLLRRLGGRKVEFGSSLILPVVIRQPSFLGFPFGVRNHHNHNLLPAETSASSELEQEAEGETRYGRRVVRSDGRGQGEGGAVPRKGHCLCDRCLHCGRGRRFDLWLRYRNFW